MAVLGPTAQLKCQFCTAPPRFHASGRHDELTLGAALELIPGVAPGQFEDLVVARRCGQPEADSHGTPPRLV
jgi:hypothetical protein